MRIIPSPAGIALTCHPHFLAIRIARSIASEPELVAAAISKPSNCSIRQRIPPFDPKTRERYITHLPTKPRVLIIVHAVTGQHDPLTLIHHRLDDLRVAVALVDGGVAGDEIDVLVALLIPDVRARCSIGNDGMGWQACDGILVCRVDDLIRESSCC